MWVVGSVELDVGIWSGLEHHLVISVCWCIAAVITAMLSQCIDLYSDDVAQDVPVHHHAGHAVLLARPGHTGLRGGLAVRALLPAQ